MNLYEENFTTISTFSVFIPIFAASKTKIH